MKISSRYWDPAQDGEPCIATCGSKFACNDLELDYTNSQSKDLLNFIAKKCHKKKPSSYLVI